jgi:hypothetical protein
VELPVNDWLGRLRGDPPAFVLPSLNATFDFALDPICSGRFSRVQRCRADLSRRKLPDRSAAAEVVRRTLHVNACNGLVYVCVGGVYVCVPG